MFNNILVLQSTFLIQRRESVIAALQVSAEFLLPMNKKGCCVKRRRERLGWWLRRWCGYGKKEHSATTLKISVPLFTGMVAKFLTGIRCSTPKRKNIQCLKRLQTLKPQNFLLGANF